MNQIKIGRFIAEERKRKKYTQKQLAEFLKISDKTISKWECGNGFPEISLLMPLCNELDISVNELLSGERLSEIEYKKKAEENMMSFIQEKENNKKKMQLTIVTGIISIVSFLTLILVVSVYAEVMSIPAKILLIAIACIIFVVGIYVAMQGERTIGYYQCKHCGEYFVPTFSAYTMGPHIFTTRKLKCPSCKKSSWCKKVMAKEEKL
jgi:transcriptional regulator with XRE-family HTH domain